MQRHILDCAVDTLRGFRARAWTEGRPTKCEVTCRTAARHLGVIARSGPSAFLMPDTIMLETLNALEKSSYLVSRKGRGKFFRLDPADVRPWLPDGCLYTTVNGTHSKWAAITTWMGSVPYNFSNPEDLRVASSAPMGPFFSEKLGISWPWNDLASQRRREKAAATWKVERSFGTGWRIDSAWGGFQDHYVVSAPLRDVSLLMALCWNAMQYRRWDLVRQDLYERT